MVTSLKLDTEHLLCMLLVIPFFTQIILGTAVRHIHDLGKSKTLLKKHRKGCPLWKRVLLIGYARECKYYAAQAQRLTIAYWIGFVWPVVDVLSLVWYRTFGSALHVLRVLVYGKGILFDIPAFVFFFLMTKHGKNGGVTWKWEVPH